MDTGTACAPTEGMTHILNALAAFLGICGTELFRVPAHRWEYLVKRIEKIERKRQRLGARAEGLADDTPITVEHGATVTKPGLCHECNLVAAECRCEFPQIGADRVYYVCRVTGAAPRLDGWEFLATLQHEDAGTILRTVPGAAVAEGELNRFRNVKPACEHCNVRRFRKDSFVVRSRDGAVRQVGRNCLGAYLGGQSPVGAARLAELLIAARDAATESEDWGGHVELAAGREQFLVFVAASIRQDGWVSRTAARDSYTPKCATADAAFNLMFPGRSTKEREIARKFAASITDEDHELAAAALERAAKDLVYTEDPADDLGDYEHNLRVAVASETVTGKRAGLVASLIPWYQRKIGREVEYARRAEVAKNSEHVGAVGDKVTRDMTVTAIHDSESDWGVSHGHKFLDTDGNAFVWWTGSYRLEVGCTYRVRGTVKKHGEYKGLKETQLTRCKPAPVNALQKDLRAAVRGHERVGKGSAAALDDAALDALLAGCVSDKEALKAARANDRAVKGSK